MTSDKINNHRDSLDIVKYMKKTKNTFKIIHIRGMIVPIIIKIVKINAIPSRIKVTDIDKNRLV